MSILIPTHNRSGLLARTLESLRGVRVPSALRGGVEVVVVANNCSDDTVAVAEAGLAELAAAWETADGGVVRGGVVRGGVVRGGGVRVVEEAEPGLNPARTRAVAESTGEVCALLDDDVWLTEGWLEGLIEAYDRHGADLVGGRIDLWWEAVPRPDWLPKMADSLLSGNDLGDEVQVLSGSTGMVGANFSFRRAVYDHIGGFRPGLDRVGTQLLGGGETDFAQRALAAGFRAVYSPAARLKHWVAPERLTAAYLTGVARGNGTSRVLMKPALPTAAAARTLAGHAWLAVSNGLAIPWATLRGDRRAQLVRRCRCAVGRGGLRGVVQRWTRP